ncbi:hypothetical protein Ancab_021057 [Ancistrocladus abbreviatus]
MISQKRIANAVGGKTARACDYCVRKRARWYCAADDAFLCQACDGSVHSANPLARRHKRVRLNTASVKRSVEEINNGSYLVPSWHRGFRRKARTPRHGKHVNTTNGKSHQSIQNHRLPVVPEVGADDNTSHDDENEEQLLYRVPIFDPFVAQLCNRNEGASATNQIVYPDPQVERCDAVKTEAKTIGLVNDDHQDREESNSHGFLGCHMDDLAEFAADVETLLGKGLDEEPCGMEELGLLDCTCTEKDSAESSRRVKPEAEVTATGAVLACRVETAEIDVLREPFEISFDYDSPMTCEDEDMKGPVEQSMSGEQEEACVRRDDDDKKKGKIMLRLDYEAVCAAWASHGSPWMNGERPQINPDDCWPHCLGTCGAEVHHQIYGDVGVAMGLGPVGDGGREARVSRYREKRRTRLFSKKIRYEVRKLNAEKRPRMKGRFVKRSSFPLLAK